MTPPIALQLYSLRDETARDYTGTLEKVAAMGYAGVETASFTGTTVPAAAKLFKDLGLTVCSAHVALPASEQAWAEALALMAALDCRELVCPSQPRELFQSAEGVAHACAALNAASALAQSHGLRLHYHNHDYEFQMVDGRPAYDRLRDCLAPEVLLQVDTYWVKAGGVDPAALLRELGPRAPLLHIKDGPAVRGQPMQALGQGKMDIPGLLAASAGQAEWLIIELDETATDMLEALRRSYEYLVENGLGHGKN